MANRAPQTVTILLATFNGARHLGAQLASYTAQSHADWRLWVSDDGSTDETAAILRRFERGPGGSHEVRLIQGPGAGMAANFLSLLQHPDLPDGPVALSDQDDVWMPHRLARGLDLIARSPGARPVLYAANTIQTDAALRPRRMQNRAGFRPSFANALVQNIIAGNTIMLNAAAMCAIRATMPPRPDVPFHDWWLYLLLTGIGGEIVFDETPCLYYRQHHANLMGSHRGTRASARRLRLIANGTYGSWVRQNAAALSRVTPHLTPDAADRLGEVLATSGQGGLPRFRSLRRAGVFRQGRPAPGILSLLSLIARV
ncbi:glycosyltransferase [Boseongicola sp. H5]|uniref:glycosyltransferase n=1 Tax=Boseongicola sp. H5 TaxID=2763261 RepID=UPI001D0AC6F4|nr:glycosyltransferase [Boseongicola sp. H5]